MRFDASTGVYIDDFVSANSGGLDQPSGMVIGPDGHLYVGSAANDRILRYHGDTGAFINVFSVNAAIPIGLAFGPNGDLYSASRDGPGVLRFDGVSGNSEGLFATAPTRDLWWAWDLAFNASDKLFVSSFERPLKSICAIVLATASITVVALEMNQ